MDNSKRKLSIKNVKKVRKHKKQCPKCGRDGTDGKVCVYCKMSMTINTDNDIHQAQCQKCKGYFDKRTMRLRMCSKCVKESIR